MAMSRDTRNKISSSIADMERFTHASMSGGAFAGGVGVLPPECHPAVQTAGYVVYSYETPIAWHDGNGWVMPAVKYSMTTATHQAITREAIGMDRSDMTRF